MTLLVWSKNVLFHDKRLYICIYDGALHNYIFDALESLGMCSKLELSMICFSFLYWT